MVALGAGMSLLPALVAPACGGEERQSAAGPLVLEDPGPVHVHGLGSADGALYIATHAGLWRLEEGEAKAERIGESYQDTMGFTVLAPDRFLGSGHPDLADAREQGYRPCWG
jgi:hypothetical protein